MRDRAVLMELFIDGSMGNRHFHNLASWYGRTYQEVVANNPIHIPTLLGQVREVIKNIDISKY